MTITIKRHPDAATLMSAAAEDVGAVKVKVPPVAEPVTVGAVVAS